ncbi:MAG: hypothetical protein R3B06_29715 [Kofleriaceae bacterium]
MAPNIEFSTPMPHTETIQAVLARLTGTSPEAVAVDPGAYAAFFWDQSFSEGHSLDWDTWQVDDPYPALVYGRADFDLRASLFALASLVDGKVTDTALRRLLATQRGLLTGAQIEVLRGAGRLTDADLQILYVYGRVRADGTSLTDAGRAAFMLGEGAPRLASDEDSDAQVEAPWAEALADLDPDLAPHLGLFFQDGESARYSGGACVDDTPDEACELLRYLRAVWPALPVVATWWLGEGQGNLVITRAPAEAAPVPAFEGHSVFRKPAVDRTPHTLDVLAAPVRDVLAAGAEVRGVGAILAHLDGGGSLEQYIDGLDSRGQLLPLINVIGGLCGKRLGQPAVVLADAALRRATGADVVLFELNRAVAMSQLRQFGEARASGARALAAFAAHGSPHVREWLLHKNQSWFHYKLGDLAEATAAVERGLALAPDEPHLHGHRGAFLLAQDDLAGAAAALERCMAAGVDPSLDPETTTHPLYRELAIKHRIPVELAPDEVAA